MGCTSSKASNITEAKLQVDNNKQGQEGRGTGSVSIGVTASRHAGCHPETSGVANTLLSKNATVAPRQQTPAGADLQTMAVIQQVKKALQELDTINNDGSQAACQQAAKVLLQQLDICDMISSQTSGPYLYAPGTTEDSKGSLPNDWLRLQESSSLRTFLAVRVQGASEGALGVLTLASKKVSAFRDVWLEPLISMVCSGIVPFLSHPAMAGLRQLADSIHDKSDQEWEPFVAELVKAIALSLKASTKKSFALRLGLTGSQGGQQQITMLQDMSQVDRGAGELPTGAVEEDSGELEVVTVPATPSLLLDALTSNEPQLLSSTRQYLEVTMLPAMDLFFEGQPAAASLLVLPLSLDGKSDDTACKAGLYLASNGATDFADSMPAITSTVTILQWLLAPHLQHGGLLSQAFVKLLDNKSAQHQRLATGGSTGGSSVNATGGDMSAMMQMLQQQLRENVANRQQRASRAGTAEYLEDLVLQRVLGTGGFGTVYAGRWKGSPAAIKVMAVPKQQRQMMKSAMEMAVQESLSHPNIVRVYAVHADMVHEEGVDVRLSRFRPHGLESEDEDQIICNVMIMEMCEEGSLHDNIRRGLLHRRDQGGLIRVNLAHVLLVLMDIARSLQHLHAHQMIHCDLKPANVLLKRSPDSPKGYVCKLADFGLVKMMGEGRTHLNNKSVSGTITHVPPERFKTGTPLNGAVDIYAFAMIMYEVYTGKRPFEGHSPGQIVALVVKGERPSFGGSVPEQYRQLTEACWAQDPRNRPTADQLMQRLSDILDSSAERARRTPSQG